MLLSLIDGLSNASTTRHRLNPLKAPESKDDSLSLLNCPKGSRVTFVRTMGYKTIDTILDRLQLISNYSWTQFGYNLEQNYHWNYHRKICLPSLDSSTPISSNSSSSSSLSSPFSSCTVKWFFEKVPNSQLHGVNEKLLNSIKSEDDCLSACFNERQFICRSVRFDHVRSICALSRHDRRTSQESFRKNINSNHHSVSYFENQCVQEPPRCTFRRLDDYQLSESQIMLNLTGLTLEDCEKSCLSEQSFICRSFIHYHHLLGVCLLSPEDSLSLGENGIKDIKSLTLSSPLSPSTDGFPMNLYEKASCIDVNIKCEANEMIAIIKTSGPFKGRLFTLTHPQECYNIGTEEPDDTIALSIPLHGGQCGTQNLRNGTFVNSLIVQRHPLILRETDRRIDVVCDYQQITRKLRSGKQVSEGDAIAMTQVVTGLASTPPVRLRVVNSTGNEVKDVELGDPLYLKVEMLDESVFGIFGSELVAKSGEGSESVVLIDDQGCPVEPNVFPGLAKADRTSKALVAPFQAFRFATDPSVKFQMTVSFCLDTCPPVSCGGDKLNETTSNANAYEIVGRTGRSDESFGKRRRRRSDFSDVDRVYGSSDNAAKSDKEAQSGDILTDITMETTFFIVNNLKADSSLNESTKLKHIRSLKHQTDVNSKRDIQILACNSSEVHFELLSGSMLAANAYKITRDLDPGVCLKLCLQDSSCLSVNIDYKKGTCSFNGQNLRTSGIDRNLRSSPFFNYFEKVCLIRSSAASTPLTNSTITPHSVSCSNKDWSFERIRGKELIGLPFEKIVVEASTREQCELACLDYQPFTCLSAEFNYQMNECRLSPYNRFSSLNKQVRLEPSTSLVDYLENNCAQGPRAFCSWKSSKQNRLILSDKTIITANATTCQDECLNSQNFICRSFTFDSVSLTCSLSHHTRRSVPGAALLKTPSSIVYEISTCFDVSIDCGPDMMKAKVTSSTLFQGKLYARERPTSCFVDIANSMDFTLPIQLKGDDCATQEESEGTFINTLIIQSNDHVITSVDKAIGVRCSYDVGNITGETVLNIE
uniref:ZP domain-containing protein n=1 Tax=Tetranychus urticae TaxID=32264 RepID=T1K7E7_TETUR